MGILIEFNFKWIGKRLKAEEIQSKYEKILKEYFSDVIDYKVISTTSMGRWLIVLIDFPNVFRVDDYNERILDAVAGAIVYALEGNVRYRHYEIHGKTGSLIYHKDWRWLIALNVIAKDEGKYIKEFLKKHKEFFDDIVVVVDKRTQDNTADEAKEAGARVFFEEWKDDFSKLRNRALNETDPRIQWILKLDVDEELSEEAMKNLRKLCLDDRYDAYEFIIDNKVTKDAYPQLRLFRKLPQIRWEGIVHEVIRGIPKERIKRTNYKIIHYQRWIAEGRIEERNKFYRRLEAINK